MKYQTSPPVTRCSSPFSMESNSSLPLPVTHNCIGAATKCYKYLRKLFKFDQMDFEFAVWQMIYLFVAPQKVYRNFQSRKQTKSQFARDDPAFLVLLFGWLLISSIIFTVVFGLGFFQFITFFIYFVAVDCIAVGVIAASIFWFITNRHLRIDRTQDVEWGYAFDIHLNAYLPPLVILHVFQLFLYTIISRDTFGSRFLGNTFWLIAVTYYIYITFLGYTSIEILHGTHIILLALPVCFVIYVISLAAGINISYLIMWFYYTRVS